MDNRLDNHSESDRVSTAPHGQAYKNKAPVRDGVILPPSPTVRLVQPRQTLRVRTWDEPLPDRGVWQVLGAAGTGVSSLLIDTVIQRIESGYDPAGILVLTNSKEASGLLRRELSQRLDDYAAPTSMVRSMHSLAFALLRKAQASDVAAGLIPDNPLRLITGAEQDAVIRQLLEGHVDSGGGAWPGFIRPALPMVGFARQLRDFMLRAGERGLGPTEITELGQRYNQPMWQATGAFMAEYEQVMALSGKRSYSAAELVSQVALRPEITSTHPWHTIVVDDAQLLDPNAGRLICSLIPDTELCVIGGDPEQAVFAFRGANEEFLSQLPATLGAQGISVHTRRLVQPRRVPSPACVDIVADAGTQRDAVADLVRRRHLEDGVGWADIAVIVRGGGDIGQVRRTLLAAGVPVHINPTDVVLAEQRLVAAVLQAVRAATQAIPRAADDAAGQLGVDPAVIDNAELEELLTGPVGGADPVSMRRLIRGLRRWNPRQRGVDSLRQVLAGQLPDFKGLLTGREEAILVRIRGILEAGAAAHAGGASIEETLWAVWDATKLANRLQAAALRGGATGSQADRDLDAMMALFDAAGDYSERYPEASLEAFLEFILEQELPTGVRDRRAAVPEAVEVISAHGAVGREWDTVVVVGAQEGSWPSLGETGSIFGQEDLIDLIDHGIAPGSHVSHLAERLGEERRLFHVATSRHRRRLAIVAIDAPDADQVFEPSRFITEFCGPGLNLPGRLARREATEWLRRTALARELGLDVASAASYNAGNGDAEPGELDPLAVPVLSVPAFVAHLRRVLKDPLSPETTRGQAARQLARLAAAGVPGAHPQQWWGVRQVASASPLPAVPTVSPSRVEALLNCPLNAVLARVSENGEAAQSDTSALVKGNLAHAYLEALGRGMDAKEAAELTRQAYLKVLDVPAWKRDYELAQFDRLLERIFEWAASSRSAFELVGVEVPVSVQVAEGLKIFGYIDRLERGGQDYYAVDLKTSKQPARIEQAQDNAQLATYQLALAHGAVEQGPDGPRIVTAQPGLSVGGGALVYPNTTHAEVVVRTQAAWEPEELASFAAMLPQLVAYMRGPEIPAQENPGCDICPIKTLCPVRPEGRMTTHAA